MDITFVYSDISDFNKIREASIKGTPLFTFIDDQTYKGKKEAFALKGHWGARLSPFAICYENNKPVKVFYSEAGNVIEDLIAYLNNL